MRATTNKKKEKHRNLIAKHIAEFESAGKEVYQAVNGESGYRTLFSFGVKPKGDWQTRNEETKGARS